MAVQNFYNAKLIINSVNLSDHVESVKLEIKNDTLEKTAMGMDTHQFVAGLKDWSLEATFFQDYASGSVDATLWGLIGSAAVTFQLNPDNSANAITNPAYSGSLILEGYQPIGGGVGTLQKVQATFKPASALARATS